MSDAGSTPNSEDHGGRNGRPWITHLANVDPRAHDAVQSLLANYAQDGERLLTPRLMHLIWVAVDSVVTHLYPYGARIHITEAMDHGATPQEITEVFEIAATVADRSLRGAYPAVLAAAAGASVDVDRGALSAEDEQLTAALTAKLGFLPDWVEPALRVSPTFVRKYLDVNHAPDRPGALDASERALIYVGVFSNPATLDVDEVRRHSEQALAAGISVEQLLLTVELAVGVYVHSFTEGMPLLAEVQSEKG